MSLRIEFDIPRYICTPRAMCVAGWILGKDDKEIAFDLKRSIKTVQFHWREIKQLTKVKNKIELIWYAYEHHWIKVFNPNKRKDDKITVDLSFLDV